MALQKIIKNGTETGATVADKINAIIDSVNALSSIDLSSFTSSIRENSSNIAQNIIDIEDNALGIENLDETLTNVIADVATLSSEIIQINTLHLVSLSTVTASTIPLTTSFSKISFVDTLAIDENNGAYSIDLVGDTVTIVSSGIYEVSASGSITGPNGAKVSFSYFVNGVELAPGASPIFATAGASDPVGISDFRYISATAGDVIDIRAKIDSAADIDILASSLSIKKQ